MNNKKNSILFFSFKQRLGHVEIEKYLNKLTEITALQIQGIFLR